MLCINFLNSVYFLNIYDKTEGNQVEIVE